jgi:hypothetical protein
MPGMPPPPFGMANGGVGNGKGTEADVNGGYKRPASVSFEEDPRRKQPRNR